MLRRKWRLHRREDYARLRVEGRSEKGRGLLLSHTANSIGHNRYGFIVSKQIGKAVTRNRLRRQLREIVRTLHPQIAPGFDLVFIARSGIVEQPYAALQRTVLELVRRARLLKETPS